MTLQQAAAELGVGVTTLKKVSLGGQPGEGLSRSCLQLQKGPRQPGSGLMLTWAARLLRPCSCAARTGSAAGPTVRAARCGTCVTRCG